MDKSFKQLWKPPHPSLNHQPPHRKRRRCRCPEGCLTSFAAPGEVFNEIATAPARAANWLAPAILLIVLSWVSGWLIFSQPSIQQQMKDISNKAIDRQVEKGKLTSSQADQARAAAEKFGSIGYKVGAVVAPVFMAFITPFWGGLILWLVGSFALKAPFPYLKAVEIAGLANMILILDVVVRTLLVLITGNLFSTLSLSLVGKRF